MKIKQGFSLKKENGQNIIVCDRNLHKDFTSLIQLTDTCAFLWDMIIKGNNPTKEDMLNALLDNFDISTILALNDIDMFIRILTENGILE